MMTCRSLVAIAAVCFTAGPAFGITWDTNDDGAVDAKEFATGNATAATFNRFDDDNDGAITPHELGLSEPDKIFKKADNNSDGVLMRSELTQATFGSYDRDKDGMLDEREMMQFQYDEGRRNSPFADWDAVRRGKEISQ